MAAINSSKITIIFIMVCLVFASFYSPINTNLLVNAESSYSGIPKPMEFYFHNLDVPVKVAGLETKDIMDTTKSFRFLNEDDAFSNSFYKQIGQPKIAIAFYIYPNFAGAVTMDGTWQVSLWVNGSAYKPTGFTVEFQEHTIDGVKLWDSGQISPTITSSIGEYIDVPVYNYNLSTRLTHTFNPNSTLLVVVEVNSGSSVATRIWYDSPSYPSKVILPAKDYARPVEVKTYAYDGREADLFCSNCSQDQSIVTVRTNVWDPYYGYDVHNVTMTIVDPFNSSVVKDAEMVLKTNELWQLRPLNTYEANWSYPLTAPLGNYTVQISVIDNNGYYRNQETGSPNPFVEYETKWFTIGNLVYYDPALLVEDDASTPLPNAQVYVTWPNGSRDALPRYTSADGIVNLMHVLPGYYNVTVLWKDTLVKQASLYISSDGPYPIKTAVYQLSVSVLSNNREPLQGAYVIAYTQSNLGYGFGITNSSGVATFKLPPGNYDIEVHYVGTYLLSLLTTNATDHLMSFNSSTARTIVLADFPPPIWVTLGFALLIAVLVTMLIIIVAIIMLRRKTTKM